MAEIRLGTSGWSYKHWKGVFYPKKLAQKKWFEYFATTFDTVELNAPFYRIPKNNVVATWQSHSPERFCFSVKMNRRVTHVKKLHNCQSEIDLFFAAFNALQPKIRVILIQLPPVLSSNITLLTEFAFCLPENYRYAFEFRNPTWYNSEIFNFLELRHFAFCIHDMHALATPRVVTSDLVYIRFHGYDTLYGGEYPDSTLRKWATWIQSQYSDGKSVYGYFNNDIGGFAVKNCMRLKEMIGEFN